MKISITLLDGFQDLFEVMQIRLEVFINEQKVSKDEEFDEFEKSSLHFLAKVEEKAVGTARIRKTTHGTKLERFAVLMPFRKQGIASKILEEILKHPWVQSSDYVYLHAQLTAKDFYKKNGFVEVGDEFEEAGIQHIKMFLPK